VGGQMGAKGAAIRSLSPYSPQQYYNQKGESKMLTKGFHLIATKIVICVIIIFSMTTFVFAAPLATTVKAVIYVFDDKNFGGHYRVLTSDEPDFDNIDFGGGGRVSSIKIYRNSNYTGKVKVEFYEHRNYEGPRHISLHAGEQADNLSLPKWDFNDKIHSMRILDAK
jgi:hypothetical protein